MRLCGDRLMSQCANVRVVHPPLTPLACVPVQTWTSKNLCAPRTTVRRRERWPPTKRSWVRRCVASGAPSWRRSSQRIGQLKRRWQRRRSSLGAGVALGWGWREISMWANKWGCCRGSLGCCLFSRGRGAVCSPVCVCVCAVQRPTNDPPTPATTMRLQLPTYIWRIPKSSPTVVRNRGAPAASVFRCLVAWKCAAEGLCVK